MLLFWPREHSAHATFSNPTRHTVARHRHTSHISAMLGLLRLRRVPLRARTLNPALSRPRRLASRHTLRLAVAPVMRDAINGNQRSSLRLAVGARVELIPRARVLEYGPFGIEGFEEGSVLIGRLERAHLTESRALRGHQRSSEVIRCHQKS